ncbi:MAG: 3-dehydroquinate synthase, partial [Acidobacteriota bacterium]|nr:3-dehydroquinate synthase [Acidobacteriota bacterium]
MQRLTVSSSHGDYTIVAHPGAIDDLQRVFLEEDVRLPLSVVSNTTVAPLWAEEVARSLSAPLIELADGEAEKMWPTVEGLLGRWLEIGLTRGDVVGAIGGGVVTDTAGFAAAVYLRGISWIAVPTTLLAMVDASVGGKTGVNLAHGKNLVGAFWPPRLVVVDVATLGTLPSRELQAGLAEVIKTAWIGDHDLLEMISSPLTDFGSLTPDGWQELVMRCLTVKARVVSDDEREAGQRAALNLGHTLGHALEAATGYRHFLHGEAVAWGLLAAARLARRNGVLSAAGEDRIRAALGSIENMPPISGIDPEDLRSHISRDKKRDDEGVAWVLPTDEGVVLNQRVATDEALEVFV